MTGGERHVPAWLETATAVGWRALVALAASFAAVLALSRLSVVVIPLIGALFVSAILVPPARWLRRHGWPSLIATWATFLAAVAVAAGVGAWLVPRVADQWNPLRQSLAKTVDDTRDWLIDCLWGGRPRTAAEQDLSTNIWLLRSLLGERRVPSRPRHRRADLGTARRGTVVSDGRFQQGGANAERGLEPRRLL